MKVNYDPVEDTLYIVIKKGLVLDSKEIGEDIRVEYDRKGNLAGLEIVNARRNLARTFAHEIAKEIGVAT